MAFVLVWWPDELESPPDPGLSSFWRDEAKSEDPGFVPGGFCKPLFPWYGLVLDICVFGWIFCIGPCCECLEVLPADVVEPGIRSFLTLILFCCRGEGVWRFDEEEVPLVSLLLCNILLEPTEEALAVPFSWLLLLLLILLFMLLLDGGLLPDSADLPVPTEAEFIDEGSRFLAAADCNFDEDFKLPLDFCSESLLSESLSLSSLELPLESLESLPLELELLVLFLLLLLLVLCRLELFAPALAACLAPFFFSPVLSLPNSFFWTSSKRLSNSSFFCCCSACCWRKIRLNLFRK